MSDRPRLALVPASDPDAHEPTDRDAATAAALQAYLRVAHPETARRVDVRL